MIPPSELYAAVPKAGVERALSVWTMLQDQARFGVMEPEELIARTILAYAEWLYSQPGEVQKTAFLSSDSLIRSIVTARLKYKRNVAANVIEFKPVAR